MRHPKYGKFYRGQMPQMMNGWNTIVGLYDSPQDIDLYVGVLNEVHMQGAQVGPTAGCIIAGKVDIRVDQSGLSGDCPGTDGKTQV